MINSRHYLKQTPIPKIIVVIPAHNEQKTICTIVANIAETTNCEVVVVDDASSDQTASLARETGAHVLPLPVQLGAWGAMQAGIRYAAKQNSDIVITIDADGQHNPKHISLLLQEFTDNKSDVVIASCISRGSWQRHLAWRFFRFVTGLNLEDLTSGFRLYGKKAIHLLASSQATLLDYQDIGVLLLLQKNNMTIREIQIQMENRLVGHSHIFFSWFAVLKYMACSILLSFSRRNHLFFPAQRSK